MIPRSPYYLEAHRTLGNILWIQSLTLVSGQRMGVFLPMLTLSDRYESVAWIPNVITFIVLLGIGGKNLNNAPATAPVTASSVITFATTTASSVISWCMMTPDYGVYHNGKTPT